MSHPFYSLNVFRVALLFKLPEDSNVKQHHTYEGDKQHKWHWSWTWTSTSSFPPSWCRCYGLQCLLLHPCLDDCVWKLVSCAFRVNRRLRRTTNLLFMFLAIADLLIGTVSVPLWVYISVTYTVRGPLYNFYLIFDVICGVSSILNLTAISLERCYALLHPIKHRNIRKRKSQYSLLVLQGGRAFRALDLKFDGPEFKSPPDH